MEHSTHSTWDQEEADRLVGEALARLKEVGPRSHSEAIKQATSEIEASMRLQRPNSLRDALTTLHFLLDETERNRAKRARSSRG